MLYSSIKHCKSNTVNEKKNQRKENNKNDLKENLNCSNKKCTIVYDHYNCVQEKF